MGLTAVGAGKGSRTLLSSLGSLRSTDELYLRVWFDLEQCILFFTFSIIKHENQIPFPEKFSGRIL